MRWRSPRRRRRAAPPISARSPSCLTKIGACAVDEEAAALELELFVGAEPAVLAAGGELKRR